MDPGMGDAIKALATCWAMLALGNECFEAGGATFIRNPDIPGRRDANHVARVTASTEREMDRLLARAEIEFGRLLPSALRCGPYHPAHLPRPSCPRRLPAARRPCDDLTGDRARPPEPHDIRPVVSDADWDALAAIGALARLEYRHRTGDPDWGKSECEATHEAWVKFPQVRYWLSHVDGEPRAHFSSWAGVDGVGQVEDLYTHHDFRYRGLATALIHHRVADSRAKGAEAVVITADPADTLKRMFAAIGFRPVAITSEYVKDAA